MSGYQSYLRALGYTDDEAFRIGQLVDGDEVPPLSDQTADIGDALAAEEHRQGMAYGDDADHCGDCKREAYLRLQAECEHEGDQIDVSTCGSRELLCQRCGTIREVER